MDCLDSPQNKNEKKESDLTEDKTLLQATISAELAKEVSKDVVQEKPFAIPRYNLTERIGRGTFGEVWKAVQTKTGQDVAVKVFTRKETMDMGYLGREVDKLRRIAKHPYIMTLLDADIGADNPFYVMYILPKSLKNIIGDTDYEAGEHRKKEFVEKAVKWFTEACEALSYMHNKGIFHCDIKPANMLIDENENVRLADFGQSQISGERSSALGTLWFMPPEQADPDAVPEASWDIYSLGATMYYLLTGKRPYCTNENKKKIEDSPDTTRRLQSYREIIQSTPLKPIRELNSKVDEDLAAIVEHCLSPDPGKRYKSIGQITEDLDSRVKNKPLLCRPHTLTYVMGCFMRRYKTPLTLGFISLLLIVVITAASFFNVVKSRNEAIVAGDREKNARQKAKEAAEKEKKAKKEIQEQLAYSMFKKGLQKAKKFNNWSAGLMWFAEALTLMPDNKSFRLSTGYALRKTDIELQSILKHEKDVHKAIFGHKGNLIITDSSTYGYGKKEGMIQVWDVAKGKSIYSNTIQDKYLSFVVSPDRKKFINCLGKTAHVIDMRTGGLILKPLNHHSNITRAFFSHSGKLIATVANKIIYIWDTKEGKRVCSPLKHDTVVRSASFSPKEDIIVTTSKDKTTLIWDIESGKIDSKIEHDLSRWNDSFFMGQDAVFSSNGRYILFKSRLVEDGKGGPQPFFVMQIWDLEKEKFITQKIKTFSADSILFSPDSRFFVVIPGNKNVEVWDLEKLVPLYFLKHSGKAISALFTPNSKLLITRSTDDLMIWDMNTGSPLSSLKHYWNVLAIDNNGNRIILKSFDEVVRLINPKTGKIISYPLRHSRRITSASFSLDGTQFAISSDLGKTTWIWRKRKIINSPLYQLKKNQYFHSFSPNGKKIIFFERIKFNGGFYAGGAKHKIFILDIETGNISKVWEIKYRDADYSSNFSQNARLVIVFSNQQISDGKYEGLVLIWDVKTQKPVFSPIRGRRLKYRNSNFCELIPSQMLCLSPDGELLLTLTEYGNIAQVWDAKTGKPVFRPMMKGDEVTSASFSPDGKYILTITKHGEFTRIWDVSTGETVCSPIRHLDGQAFRSACFSPDGKRVLTFVYEELANCGEAKVWDVETGKSITPPLRHDLSGIKSALFSPDGKLILTVCCGYGDENGEMCLWDANSGKLVASPMKHDDLIRSAVFSPDGKYILTTSSQNIVRVWEVKTGGTLLSRMEPLEVSHSVSGDVQANFSPDGSLIMVAAGGDRGNIWDPKSGDPVAPTYYSFSSHAIFDPQGKSIIFGNKLYKLPMLENIPTSIVKWKVQVLTGTYLDHTGTLNFLTSKEWQKKKKLLGEWEKEHGEVK